MSPLPPREHPPRRPLGPFLLPPESRGPPAGSVPCLTTCVCVSRCFQNPSPLSPSRAERCQVRGRPQTQQRSSKTRVHPSWLRAPWACWDPLWFCTTSFLPFQRPRDGSVVVLVLRGSDSCVDGTSGPPPPHPQYGQGQTPLAPFPRPPWGCGRKSPSGEGSTHPRPGPPSSDWPSPGALCFPAWC